MSRRSISDWLSDIIAWGERLEGHMAGKTYEDFLDDPIRQDAASKCVEAIGVAANELQRLAPNIEGEYPNLQLSLAYKARNKLSHYAVDAGILGVPLGRPFRRRLRRPETPNANTIAKMMTVEAAALQAGCRYEPL